MENMIVLITGANRGIGRGLSELFLSRPNHTVIAGVRDLASPSTLSLKDFQPASGSSLVLVRIEGSSPTDAAEALQTVQASGITTLDLVIANAGVAFSGKRLEDIDVGELETMLSVNTVGSVRLYQAVYPLLKATAEKKGAGAPKFVFMSSMGGSTARIDKYGKLKLVHYGASKAAMNHLVRHAHFQNSWLVAFSLHPGLVATDMGNKAAKDWGLEKAYLTLEESVDHIIKIIDSATRESISGNLVSHDGSMIDY